MASSTKGYWGQRVVSVCLLSTVVFWLCLGARNTAVTRTDTVPVLTKLISTGSGESKEISKITMTVTVTVLWSDKQRDGMTWLVGGGKLGGVCLNRFPGRCSEKWSFELRPRESDPSRGMEHRQVWVPLQVRWAWHGSSIQYIDSTRFSAVTYSKNLDPIWGNSLVQLSDSSSSLLMDFSFWFCPSSISLPLSR